MPKTTFPAVSELSSLNEIMDVRNSEALTFSHYFSHIKANTSEFQKAILPFLNSDWDKNSELLIAKLQTFSGELENNIYRECISATKDYINSRDFIAPNKYETTSYFYGVLQYNSETQALENLNQKLDQFFQNIPQKTTTWVETFEELYAKTASTLLSAFDFAKENPVLAVAGLLYAQTVLAAAIFPPAIELSSLNGKNGFKINGENIDDYSGYSVSSAGDINGDGIGDLIIGARGADPNGKSSAGSSYVIFGKNGTWTTPFELSMTDGANGFKINGENIDDYSGYLVNSIGDINGDGIDDLIVGTPYADPNGKVWAGSTYVIFGKNSTWTTPLELSTLNGTNGFKINGENNYDYSGRSVSSAGDINGDGINDLIIGARGANPNGKSSAGSSYVIFGKKANWTTPFELSALDGSNGFKINGELSSDCSGHSVGSAGDINGDGYDDLIIGAPFADPNEKSNAGSSYIIFGKNGTWTTPFELSMLNGMNGFKINGESIYGYSGKSVSNAGDINGDRIDDLIIGANRASPNGKISAGSSYVIFGKNNNTWTTPLELSILNETNGFKINGNSYDCSGYLAGTAGDINGDGIDDLIIAAYCEEITVGSTYVIFGKNGTWTTSLELSTLNGINGFKINGNNYDCSGYSVSAAGDINGDGISDIIIGAYGANPNGKSKAGSSYVIFGDMAPELIANQLQVYKGKVHDITKSNLKAVNLHGVDDEDIKFVISELQHGWFRYASTPNATITTFYQQNITDYQVQFVHDGGDILPSYSIVVYSSNFAYSDFPQPALITWWPMDIPWITINDNAVIYIERDTDTKIDINLAITDFDSSYLVNATVSIVNNFDDTQDELTIPILTDMEFEYDADIGVLTINGSASIAEYQNILRNVIYYNPSINPSTETRTIEFVVNDEAHASNHAIRNIQIISINEAPKLTTTNSTLHYVENDPPIIIDPYITISNDPDRTDLLVNAKISIIENFNPSQDVLALLTQNGISGSYNSTMGILLLTGSTNIANYQAALRNVTYENLSNNPITDIRTISFVVNDNFDDSIPVMRQINITAINSAPIVTIKRQKMVYIWNEGSKEIDPDLMIIDDGENLVNATLSIINNFNPNYDVLTFNDQNGITGGYNSTTGVLILSGASSVINYQTALRSIKYENLSKQHLEKPRTITFKIHDGQYESTEEICDIRIVTQIRFPAVIELSALNGKNGFKINGEETFDQSGCSVSTAGDINGDGVADLIIGAEYIMANGGGYVIFGGHNIWETPFELSTLNGLNGVKIHSATFIGFAGHSVNIAGDINGDGIDDLIIGEPYLASSTDGASYIIFGKQGSWDGVIWLPDLNGSNGFKIVGAENSYCGCSVSMAGDINGDGLDDLVIGANGSNYIVFGKNATWISPFDLSILDGTNGFKIQGEMGSGYGCNIVSNAGDINGDGIDDVIIGTYSASYVLFGKKEGWSTPFQFSTLDGSNGFKITINSGSASIPVKVSLAGDINGDGVDDIIMGTVNAGYVLFGQKGNWATPFELSTLDGSNGFKINSGISSIGLAGDINQDGLDDIIIGVSTANPNGKVNAGSTYVIFGRSGVWPNPFEFSILNGTNGFKVNGEVEDDYSGYSVSLAGDINGDGVDDIIIGAYYADPNGKDKAGSSYVVFGDSSNELICNEMVIYANETKLLTLDNLNAIEISDNPVFLINNLQHGRFEYIGNRGMPINNFTKYDIENDLVQFVHDGSGNAPSYDVEIAHAGLALTHYLVSQTAAIKFIHRTHFPAVVELFNLNTATGIKINGELSDSKSGYAVSFAGDVNNDGMSDLIIGAPGISKTYVIFGKNETWNFPFDLAMLNGTDGFKINCETGDSSCGYAVSFIGDINRDDIADFMIGAPHGYFVDDGGVSYVVFGKKNNTWVTPFELSSLNGINGFKINGDIATGWIGYSTGFLGDINGDETTDIIIGGITKHQYGACGGAYILFGENDSWMTPLNLSTLNGNNGFVIENDADNCCWTPEEFRSSVNGIGDINGDGIDDMVIGIYANDITGQMFWNNPSYVIFGKNGIWPNPFKLSTLDGVNGFKILGETYEAFSGSAVNSAGDINGDGIPDLIVGLYYENPNGKSDAGSSYVIFGRNGVWPNPFMLSTLNGVNGFKINGEAINDYSGWSISEARDINGDGIDDLIIGAYGADPAVKIEAGASYIIFGHKGNWTTPIELSELDGVNGFKINGELAGDQSGYSVSSVGDINGDGIDDVIIGAPYADPNGKSNAGSSYVIFGDISPEFSANQLTIKKGETKLITVDNFNAYDVNQPNSLFKFTINDLQQGRFEYIDDPGVTITTFTFSEIEDKKIQFVHDGSETVPSFRTKVNSDGLAYLELDALVSFISINDLSRVTIDDGILTYTEKDLATNISPSMNVTDSDNTLLRSATISIISNFNPSQDELVFEDQNGIIGFYNNVIGTLELTGYATIADYQAALRNVKYINLSDNPTTKTRVISFIVNDGVDNSLAVTRNINVNAINDLPELAGSGGILDYYEKGTPKAIDSDILVSDVDNVDLVEATVAITNNFNSAQDVLYFINQNGITGVYNNATGILALTGTATITRYQIALRTVKYENLSDNPTTDLRTISFVVNDGLNNSLPITRDINVIAINDIPILSGSGGTINYTENDSAKIIDSNITITDADNTDLSGATISITSNFNPTQDVLSFTDQNGIIGYYNSWTGILMLSGTSNITNYQMALHSITYENTSDQPTTGMRTISFVVNDGQSNSAAITRQINIISVNDAPILATDTTSALSYTENSAAAIVDSGITISDDGANLANATVVITENFNANQDILLFTNQNNIAGLYNNQTGILNLLGSSSIYNYQTALRSVQYYNPSDNPSIALRTITLTVNDGVANSNQITREVQVIAVNDAPTLIGNGTAINYTENESAKIIDSNIAITDVDNTDLSGATISITSNFNPNQDVLSFTNQNGITGYYNSGTGILTLSGTSSIDDYQTALRSIAYENTSDQPTTGMRTISFVVNDGQSNSAAITRQINIISVNDAPILASDTTNVLSYTENSAAAIVDSGITISDDGTNLANATVAITENFNANQDTLLFTDQNNIVGLYNNQTGILSLTGSSSIYNYQTALRSVQYYNPSDNPSIALRTITFTVNDGVANSNQITREVQVIAVNDAPTLIGSGTAINYTENESAKIIDSNITITDIDNTVLSGATISITSNFNPNQDVLSFTDQNGIIGFYNSWNGVLMLSGTSSIANYQEALCSITYENISDKPTIGARKISFVVNDGQSNSAAITQQINVISVNDKPVMTSENTEALGYTENSIAKVIDSTITITDDNTNLANATVAIVSNFNSAQDQLIFVDQSGITGIYNNMTGILSLTGSANILYYQTALRTVRYYNPSNNPTTFPRTIAFTVSDGDLNSEPTTRNVEILAVNDVPVLTGSGGNVTYIENTPAIVIDPNIVITDVDNTELSGATVSITRNFNSAQDVLNFADKYGIVSFYNSANGVLDLVGTASIANYQAALREITYENLSDNPTPLPRTISFMANDGMGNSAAVTREVCIEYHNDAPVLSDNGGDIDYTENDPAKAIASEIAITDVDTKNLISAEVAIINNFDATQDELVFTNQNGITGFYNDTNGVLTLTGSATVIQYQIALRSIKYRNLSDNPTTNSRTIAIKVNDGGGDSNIITKNIMLTAVNDAPTITENRLIITEGQTITLSDMELKADDPDNDVNDLVFTVSSIQHGQFQTNITQEVITRFLQRNITDGNIQFIHDGSNSAPAYSIYVSDGSAISAITPTEISFTAVNDMPIIENNKLTINQGQTIYVTATDLSATDEEATKADLLFIVSNVQHGYFDNKNNPGVPITSFYQQAVMNSEIRFIHDGTEEAPSYEVAVSDGDKISSPSASTINFVKGNININQSSSGFEWEDKVVGGVIGGAVSLIFLILKIYLNYKAEQSFKKMSDEYKTSSMKKQADFQTNVLKPISKAIFDRVNIRGFFGYIDDVTMKRYLDAVVQIIDQLDAQGIDINIEKMSVVDQTKVISEIAKQTREQFIPDHAFCSCYTFFHYVKGFCISDVSPDELEQKAEIIAIAVQIELRHRKSVMKKPDAAVIEMVDVKEEKAEEVKADDVPVEIPPEAKQGAEVKDDVNAEEIHVELPEAAREGDAKENAAIAADHPIDLEAQAQKPVCSKCIGFFSCCDKANVADREIEPQMQVAAVENEPNEAVRAEELKI